MILLIIFFVSCQDSASLVMDQIACGGNTKTPAIQRLIWLGYTMAVTLVLLIAGTLTIGLLEPCISPSFIRIVDKE